MRSAGFYGSVSRNLKITLMADWRRLEAQYGGMYPELIAKFRPSENAGWKRIDNAVDNLREAIKAQAK